MGNSEVRSTTLYEETRDRYLELLTPLFFPRDPLSHDIIRYFASLLRAVGIEDKGWDPYAESRAILEDLNSLMQLNLPAERFPDESTIWRLGLVTYNQIIEMSAPYEVIANLLRFRLEEGYSPNPFFKFMTAGEKKKFKRRGLYPKQKIKIIESLSERAGLDVASIFNEFVRFDLRNAIAHADYVVANESLRCRGGTPGTSFHIPLEELDRIITSAKAFASAFFILEMEARRTWGHSAGRAIPYDRTFKGLMEVLTDQEGLMIGFKVHWPNGEESFYRRGDDRIDMVNCYLDFEGETIALFVGLYARQRGDFSPLVEKGAKPRYTPVEGGTIPPKWDFDAAKAKQGPLPEVRLTAPR